MKSIGFKNFRRFNDFPELKLGQINMLVGGNNSGKSTLVKALLLCAENVLTMVDVEVNSRNIFARPKFNFDSQLYNGVKIKSFARALTNKVAKGESNLPTEIEFSFSYSHYRFEIVVAGNPDSDLSTAEVLYASIEDTDNKRKFDHDYRNATMSFSIVGNADDVAIKYRDLVLERQFVEAKLEAISESENPNFEEAASLNQRMWSIESQMHALIIDNKKVLDQLCPEGAMEYEEDKALSFDVHYEDLMWKLISKLNSTQYKTWTVTLQQFMLIEGENLFARIIDDFREFANLPKETISETDTEIWQTIKLDMSAIDKCHREFEVTLARLKKYRPIYLTAHAATQNALYSTADLNDYNAQAVHEYFNSKIRPGEAEYEFVTKWMEKFGIGTSFEVIPVAGEAYQVKIKDQSGSETHLADKGMGSIQLMVLLLRFASIIRKYRLIPYVDRNLKPGVYYQGGDAIIVTEDDCKPFLPWSPLIVIEEPEQNLHPAMQSKLAELFLELNKNNGCQFLIETHSEYLIRKTQVLVSRENYADENDLNDHNPFKVYYFNENEDETPCFQMEYAVSGAFKNKFGSGFFDAAAESDMEIIRKEYELKKRRR